MSQPGCLSLLEWAPFRQGINWARGDCEGLPRKLVQKYSEILPGKIPQGYRDRLARKLAQEHRKRLPRKTEEHREALPRTAAKLDAGSLGVNPSAGHKSIVKACRENYKNIVKDCREILKSIVKGC